MIGLLRRWFELHRDVENQLQVDVLMLKRAAQQIEWWQQQALMSSQAAKDIAVAWRVQVEIPEVDIRDDLDLLVSELERQYAIVSEHVA